MDSSPSQGLLGTPKQYGTMTRDPKQGPQTRELPICSLFATIIVHTMIITITIIIIIIIISTIISLRLGTPFFSSVLGPMIFF